MALNLIHIQELLYLFAETDKRISLSCANGPCMTQNWSSVPIKTKVAARVLELTSERGQVCPLIKAQWKGEGKITGKWTWVTAIVNTCFPLPPEPKNPPVNFYGAPFDTIIIFFSCNLSSPVPFPPAGADQSGLVLCIRDCSGWGFWLNWRQLAPVCVWAWSQRALWGSQLSTSHTHSPTESSLQSPSDARACRAWGLAVASPSTGIWVFRLTWRCSSG